MTSALGAAGVAITAALSDFGRPSVSCWTMALGLGAREVADDRHHGARSGEEAAVKTRHIVAPDASDRFHGRRLAVRMGRIEALGEALGGDRRRLGFRLLDRRDGAALLALEHRLREGRLGQQQAHQVERRIALLGARQGAQGDARTVEIGVTAELRAGVNLLLGDRLLVQIAGAGIEQAAREGGEPHLVGRVVGRAGGEFDLQVDDRQIVALDEINACAGRRGPVLDVRHRPAPTQAAGIPVRQGKVDSCRSLSWYAACRAGQDAASCR